MAAPKPVNEGTHRSSHQLERETSHQLESETSHLLERETALNYAGQMLLDFQSIRQLEMLLSNPNESRVRVLSLEAAQQILEILHAIARLPGVLGSFIIGHDGAGLANSLPPEYDFEVIAAMSLGIHRNSVVAIRKLNHTHLHQCVAVTDDGVLVIADFGGGLLVTVTSELEIRQLLDLMRGITQFVAQ